MYKSLCFYSPNAGLNKTRTRFDIILKYDVKILKEEIAWTQRLDLNIWNA